VLPDDERDGPPRGVLVAAVIVAVAAVIGVLVFATIRQKPEGAWTHVVWDRAFARQTATPAKEATAATPATR